MTAAVGLFGLGLMGTALAGRLQATGAVIMGHDPDPDRRAAFAAMGGTVAAPPEIWAASDCVILCVFDTDQVETVLATAPDPCDACVIITSTCDPDRVAALPALSWSAVATRKKVNSARNCWTASACRSKCERRKTSLCG